MITGELAPGSKGCADWKAVDELRRLCWRDRLADLSTLDDGHDGHAMHFLVRDGGSLVAAARLCIHRVLADTPDRHLFPSALMAAHGPYGCMFRLVVHPSHRNRHISLLLDNARIEVAKRLGCRTMLIAWNPASGVQRRRRLEELGFRSISGGAMLPDGEFGRSIPFAMPLQAGEISDISDLPAASIQWEIPAEARAARL
ncbi:hypothetical protein MSC49_03260 [Methylosinus sp. C49]|uniref:GNAT family N-acetyltransferase n=1 Tax=Methylosinus sp. C49 TaxID=2699395 RepID=UPI001366DC5E|nr:GNAT family N-acetyltransferase [Methylosinus sp. C49]BBU60391.1 hypothetical protein MSC49_03260 [Methylosinus sp. C49]